MKAFDNNMDVNKQTFGLKMPPMQCQSQPSIPLTTTATKTPNVASLPTNGKDNSNQAYAITPTQLNFDAFVNNSLRDNKRQNTFQDDAYVYIPVEKKKLMNDVRVRNFVTDTVFRCVKFINTRSMLQKVMSMVSHGMNVDPNMKKFWEISYEKEVKYAINNKRNSVAQDMKKALLGKFHLFFVFSFFILIILKSF